MEETFDSLTLLLQLFTPGRTVDQQYALLARVNSEQWGALVVEANRQEVAPLLFTLLANLKASRGLGIPQKEKLHQAYFSTAAQNMLTLHYSESILTALHKSGIPTAVLKGVFLLENVYGDIGARSMSDIDLLVKKQDLPKCLEIMQELGYKPSTYFNLADKNVDIKHLPPMEKAGGPTVELHWTLLEEDEPFTIDIEALWERMVPAKIANVDTLALGIEDLILHLCLHLTYQHYLNLGLRGLMDVALVIHKFSPEIDWQKLVEIAQSWGAEKVAALTLKLVETQLNVPIPSDVLSALAPEGIELDLLENARRQLLERVSFEDHFTPDLVELSAGKNLFAKIKIGIRRILIPRIALARIYNVPPNSPRIMGLYCARLNYLIRSYGKTIVRLQRGEAGTEPARKNAEISSSLHEWMTPRKK
jgi:hypothetical protein